MLSNKSRYFFIYVCLLLLPHFAYAKALVHLLGLSVQPSPTQSKFTFMLSGKTHGKVKYSPAQNTITVEFANTYKNFNIQNVKLPGANVSTINATTKNHTVIFTFTTTVKVNWKIYFLPKQKKDKFARLLLEVNTVVADKNKTNGKTSTIDTSSLQKTFAEDIHATFAKLAASANQQRLSKDGMLSWIPCNWQTTEKKTLENGKRVFKIVIDAGHGGKDTGALGQQGSAEKDIVLSIAKKLAQQINRKPHMKAVLTRSDDYFVPLRQRLKLARKGNADLFVAIHADAFFNNNAEGASVYALSQRGATSEAARWLAKQENYAALDGVEFSALKDRSPILRYVLIDLAQTTTIRDSVRLGNKVLDALDNISALHHSHVEQAPFVVLKSPDIPSILVEVGFITNPKEEKRLRTHLYQQKIVNALQTGIEDYLRVYEKS